MIAGLGEMARMMRFRIIIAGTLFLFACRVLSCCSLHFVDTSISCHAVPSPGSCFNGAHFSAQSPLFRAHPVSLRRSSHIAALAQRLILLSRV